MAFRLLVLAERFPPEVAGGGELSAALVTQELSRLPGYQVQVITQGDGGHHEVEGVPVDRTIPRAPQALPDDITRGELLTARAGPTVAKVLRDHDMLHCVSPRAIPAAVVAARLAGRPATSVMNDTWTTCFVHTHIRRGVYCPHCSLEGLRECLEDHGGNVAAAPLLWRQFLRRRRAVSRLSGVVAVVPNIKRLLEENGVTAPIRMIPNPIDLARWEGVPERPFQEGLVVFVGRLSTGKGLIEAVEAFATASRGRDRARLEVVGDGPVLEPARRRAGELDVGERVSFLGRRDPKELTDIYGRAQVVLAPFTRVEAFGRVGFEAAAAGRPVVTTALWGGVELLHDEPGAGTVVPWDDVGAWAGALGELLDDPGLCRSMGAEAHARIQEIYGGGKLREAYHRFFEDVAAGGA